MKKTAAAKKPEPKQEPKKKVTPEPAPKLAVLPDPERAPAESVEEPSRRWKADNSKLPMVSQIQDQEMMDQAIAALQRASDAKQQKEAWERIEDQAKEELAAIAIANDMEGFRWGKLGVSARYQSRTNLSVEKLVENGVDPEVIEKSRVKGEPALTVSVIDFL